MSPLVARTPEPLTEDPFVGGNTVADVPEEFDGERFAAAGATEQELVTLAEHYDTMDRADRRRLIDWLTRSSDADVSGWLEQWRGFVQEEETRLALIDGTVEEVLDRVKAADDAERLELARRTLAAEEVMDEDARSTLVEGLEQIIAAEEQQAQERTEQGELIEGSVDVVLKRVGTDSELAARTLAAERTLKGDAARKTLVAELEALAAQRPADGSGGTDTPTPEGTPADGNAGGGGEGSDATS